MFCKLTFMARRSAQASSSLSRRSTLLQKQEVQPFAFERKLRRAKIGHEVSVMGSRAAAD
jgi:hypothetical protein